MTKNQDNSPLIVSVESRKGGVGKTTAALCLARLLRQKGYTVLVLDLDITGTDAADIVKSPFWERDIHIIEKSDEQKEYRGALNLITLFDQYFMAGMPVPDFAVHDRTLTIEFKMKNSSARVLKQKSLVKETPEYFDTQYGYLDMNSLGINNIQVIAT
jgi:cellulose biosynthesis protein BcsQ